MSGDKLYRILIVDDIDDNRFTLDLMLSVLGDFVIDEAESGPQALRMMQENAYDLVLLDIMMPGMTGLEVLEQLDLSHSESTTRIIVVSALQDMETIVKALELGALDYLPKPIEEALLAARIRQLLERHQADQVLKQHRARIDADLKKAAEIQLSLCPKDTLAFSATDGSDGQQLTFEFAGTMRPAYEVGGDFFDYFALPNGNYVFAVADACGKGAPAAIYATRVHDLLRLIARNQSAAIMADATSSLQHMLQEVNAVLCEDNESCWFVTAWVGLLEPYCQRLNWCSAGHCEALLVAEGAVTPLPSELGLPLGLDEQFSGAMSSRTIKRGETVYVYTDGITEHRQVSGGFLGIAGLTEKLLPEKTLPEKVLQEKVLSQNSGTGLSENIDRIADEVAQSNPGLEPADDMTLLGLQLH